VVASSAATGAAGGWATVALTAPLAEAQADSAVRCPGWNEGPGIRSQTRGVRPGGAAALAANSVVAALAWVRLEDQRFDPSEPGYKLDIESHKK
jgi:hypothetical protein